MNMSGILCFIHIYDISQASQVALVVKNLPANRGDTRDTGLIPGWGRPPGGGHGNPLQYFCLEKPMDRGAYELQPIESQKVGHDRTDLAHTWMIYLI